MSTSGEQSSAAGDLRTCPEDFVVEEVPLYRPSGVGTHTFLHIEKRLRNTDDVARELARMAHVSPRDVGYAGRKDRLAIARQWFSVPGLDPQVALKLELDGARVLEAVRHPHKLRTGQLRGNRFELRVRGIDAEGRSRAGRTALRLAKDGFPNRFGAQRFGAGAANPERARSWLQGTGRAVRGDRRRVRFLVSALQAAVFNEVLSRRPLRLDQLESGDVAVVHASGGLFQVTDPERENPRAEAFEISATGPIFGTRVPQPGASVAAREAEVLKSFDVPLPDQLRPPRGLRLRGGRRAVRARPQDLAVWSEGEVLHLRFGLPAGSYATVLVEELLRPAAGSVDDIDTSAGVC